MIEKYSMKRIIKNPWLHIVLFQPEIPSNTGNIARLCGATEIRLHLIHPLGFRMDNKNLKRAGLDYWDEIDVLQHKNFECFISEMDNRSNLIAFSRHADRIYTQANIKRGDYILFGRETKGLPDMIMQSYPCYSVPIWGNVRSLNLSTTVGIVTYHYLNHLGRF